MSFIETIYVYISRSHEAMVHLIKLIFLGQMHLSALLRKIVKLTSLTTHIYLLKLVNFSIVLNQRRNPQIAHCATWRPNSLPFGKISKGVGST